MNRELRDRITTGLDERVRDLDGPTLSRLRQARAVAMREYPQRHPVWLQPAWLGAGGLAAVVLAVALLLPRLPGPAPSDDALELASLEIELEVLEELDFYEWASRQEPLAGNGSST